MFSGLNLPPWLVEVLTVIVFVAAAVIVGSALSVILNMVKKHLAVRTSTDLDDRIIDAIKKPAFSLLVIAALALAAKRLELKFPEANKWFFKLSDGAIFIALAIVVTYILLRLVKIVSSWYADSVARKTQSQLDDHIVIVANRVVKIVILVIGLVTVLDHFHVDVKGLLAVLGVGSLAIALAAQDTIANMISGFIIMLDRPFRRGDRVVLASGETADVYDIGLRSSKFLTFDNSLIVVPNNELVKSKITNLSYPGEEICVKIEIGVAYGSDVDQVKSILTTAAVTHAAVLTDPQPAAFLTSFGESALNFLLTCRVASVDEQWKAAEEIRCRVYKALSEAGIEIPFPQRVVYVRSESGTDLRKTQE